MGRAGPPPRSPRRQFTRPRPYRPVGKHLFVNSFDEEDGDDDKRARIYYGASPPHAHAILSPPPLLRSPILSIWKLVPSVGAGRPVYRQLARARTRRPSTSRAEKYDDPRSGFRTRSGSSRPDRPLPGDPPRSTIVGKISRPERIRAIGGRDDPTKSSAIREKPERRLLSCPRLSVEPEYARVGGEEVRNFFENEAPTSRLHGKTRILKFRISYQLLVHFPLK